MLKSVRASLWYIWCRQDIMLTAPLAANSGTHGVEQLLRKLSGASADWWVNRNKTSRDFLFLLELEEEVELVWADGRLTDGITRVCGVYSQLTWNLPETALHRCTRSWISWWGLVPKTASCRITYEPWDLFSLFIISLIGFLFYFFNHLYNYKHSIVVKNDAKKCGLTAFTEYFFVVYNWTYNGNAAEMFLTQNEEVKEQKTHWLARQPSRWPWTSAHTLLCIMELGPWSQREQRARYQPTNTWKCSG